QLLAAEQTVVQIPQLHSPLTTDATGITQPKLRVAEPANEPQQIEPTAMSVAAVPTAVSAETVAPPEFTGLEFDADQSIQDIVDALLAGGLNFS
ncbi:MAG: hypothetical protein RLZZ458_3007, partial [Planctomycetota bacterium]